jgi:RHS repeat-associated protein
MPLYQYTGQASYLDDPLTSGVTEGFGLMFYQSRFYDPQLGRFTQADTIIPESTQGTQAWDRYAGMNNNPVRYNDPSGHVACGDDTKYACDGTKHKTSTITRSLSELAGVVEDLDDEADEIRNDPMRNALESVLNTYFSGLIGIPACTLSAGLCLLIYATRDYHYNQTIGKAIEDGLYSSADTLNDVANMIISGMAAAGERDYIAVSMTYKPATGPESAVTWSENERYLYYDDTPSTPAEYIFHVGGQGTISLTPQMASLVNLIFGGGLLP